MDEVKLYQDATSWIGQATGASDTLLHIHAGLAILVAARVLTGRSLATPLPVACVWVAGMLNEVLDYLSAGQVLPDTMTDIGNTVFWPTLLFIGLRIRRARPREVHPDRRETTRWQRTRDRFLWSRRVPVSG